MRPAAALARLRARARGGSVQTNILVVAGGTAVAQGVVILAAPLITRVYTPDEYGLFGVYFAFYTVLLAVNSLRYEYAIPLPTSDDDAAGLVWLAAGLVGITTVVFAAGLAVAGPTLLRAANAEPLLPYLWLLPLALALGGLFQVLDYWAARKKQFGRVARARMGQATGQVGAQLGIGLVSRGPLGLLVGHLAGLGLSVGALAAGARLPGPRVALGRWRALLVEHRAFALYTTWASLVDTAGVQLPAVIVSGSFSPAEAGFFAFTMRLLGAPAILVGQAVGRVFYPEMSERQDDPVRAQRFFERAAGFLLVISAPVFAFVMLVGPALFALLFGEPWRPAGHFARLLAPWFLVSLVTSPLSTLSLVRGKQKQGLGFSLLVMTLRVGSIAAGARLGSVELAVVLFAASGVLVTVVYFGWLLSLVGSTLWHWLRANAGFLAAISALTAALALVVPAVSPLGGIVLSGAVLGAACLGFAARRWSALSHA